MQTQKPSFAQMPEVPSFFDPAKFRQLYDERFPTCQAEAVRLRDKYGIQPARTDAVGERNAVFLIDFQRTFSAENLIPGASPDTQLGVPGALDDAQRFSEWFLKHAHRITRKYATLDSHRGHQIFHPSWWQDDHGNYPAPFTMMEFKNGRIVGSDGKNYTARFGVLESEAYIKALAAAGKYTLMIWPFHSMIGSLGHALIPALHEVLFFHDVLRQEETHFQLKGMQLVTEAYSGVSDEVREIEVGGKKTQIGQVYTDLTKAITNNDKVIFAGEASSHCVKATILDLAEMVYARDPAMIKKFYILEDCMSPVPQTPGGPDFPAMARAFLADCKAKGMNVVKTTDNFL